MLLFVVENEPNYIDVMHEVFDAYKIISSDKVVVDLDYFKRVLQKCIIYSSPENKEDVVEITLSSSKRQDNSVKFDSIHVFESGVYIYCFPFFTDGDLEEDRLTFDRRLVRKDELLSASLEYIYPDHYSGDSSLVDFIGEEFIKAVSISQIKMKTVKEVKNNVDYLINVMKKHTPPPPKIHLKKNNSDKARGTETLALKESFLKPSKSTNSSDANLGDDIFGIRDIMKIKNFLFGMKKERSIFSDSCIEDESILLRKNENLYTLKKDAVIRYLVILSSSMLDYPISKLFSEMYRLKLICVDEKKQVWYAFEGNKWIKLIDSAHIRRCIEEDFADSLDLFTIRLVETPQMIKSHSFSEYEHFLSEHEREMIALILGPDMTQKELKIIERIRKMCWSESFSNMIFRMSSRYLHSSNFTQKLNRNPFLFGFANGVLNLNSFSEVFREGYPDDFLSMSTNISYVPSDTEKRKILMSILDKIFPDRNVLEYVLRFLASCLRSKNVDKIFSIWTGIGDNGKSVLVSLVEKAFGEYCAKVPTSLFVSKRSSSSSATPELCIIEGRKIVFAQEPSEGEKLNPGLIKELTGGDTVYARALYDQGRNINVDAKLVLVSNKVPRVNEMTRAIWSRIRVIPFDSVFVSEYEYDEDILKHPGKKIFVRDQNIDDKLKDLAPEFMTLLVEKYYVWLKHGLQEPKSISRLTEEVKMMNDSVGEFLREKVKKRDGFKMSRGEVYEAYQHWLKTNYPKKHPADVQNFNSNMNAHGFYCDHKGRYVNIDLA